MAKFGYLPVENLPVITLTEQDLKRLKNACGIDFGEQHKTQIEAACMIPVSYFRGFHAGPDYAEVQKLLKPFYEGLRKTEKALDEIKKHRNDIVGEAICETTKWHLKDSEIPNLENIWQFYPPPAQMRVAVEQVYNNPEWKTFGGEKNRKTSMPFLPEFIFDLKKIFESAGGKASANWYDYKGERGSPFINFAWAVMQKLPSDMQLESKSAFAERIKRYLKDYRDRGRKHAAQT